MPWGAGLASSAMCAVPMPSRTRVCLTPCGKCAYWRGAQACDEEKLLGHLGVVLYEYLGEEYPEVLGSILGALKSIVNVIGMTKARPCAGSYFLCCVSPTWWCT